MASAVALTLVDETPTGTVLHRVQLTLVSSSVTARELIEQRVRSEVAQVEADAQCARALAAFENNGFLLFADDRQIESLEERIVIRPETRVSFIKLTPLVGG